jgi:hypothetical protein
LHIEGVISGAPYVELNSHSWIVSSSGYVSKISYSGKGWLSGTKNSFTAATWRKDAPKQILYTADGQWTGAFSIKNSEKKEVDTWDPKKGNIVPPIVKDIADQGPLESRRAWQKVAEGIKASNMDIVGREKTIIEEEQRALRKKEKEANQEWTRKYFDRENGYPIFDKLAKGCDIGETLAPEKTDGVWVWKENEQ